MLIIIINKSISIPTFFLYYLLLIENFFFFWNKEKKNNGNRIRIKSRIQYLNKISRR